MFFTAELENEARHLGTMRLNSWAFKKDDDSDVFMREVIQQAQTSLYPHTASPGCDQKGNLITQLLKIYSVIKFSFIQDVAIVGQ